MLLLGLKELSDLHTGLTGTRMTLFFSYSSSVHSILILVPKFTL